MWRKYGAKCGTNYISNTQGRMKVFFKRSQQFFAKFYEDLYTTKNTEPILISNYLELYKHFIGSTQGLFG